MSYTGVGVVGSNVAPEVTRPDATDRIAARDIVRRDALGRNVIVCPRGMPIPAGLDVDQADTIAAPTTPDATAPDPAYLRRPEPDIGGQQRQRTHLQRLFHLAERSR